MTNNTVDLFTIEEHAILAEWFSTKPKCDAGDIPTSWEALEALGFVGKASQYGEDAAAVAAVVLERIHDTLPQSSAQRHPSRPSLVEGFPVLSAARLKQLQSDSNSDWQISPLPKKRSQA